MHQMMSVSYAAPNRFVSVATNRQTETTVTTGTKETTTKATTPMTTLKTTMFNQISTSTSHHPLTTITTVKTTDIPRRETVDSSTTVMTTSTMEPTTETRRVIKVRFPQRTSMEQQKTDNSTISTAVSNLIPVRNSIEGTTTTPSIKTTTTTSTSTSTLTSTTTATTNTVSENTGIDELNGIVAAVKARRHLVSNTDEIIGKLSRVADVVEQQAKPITEFPLPSNDTNLGQWHELLNGFRSTTTKTMVNTLPKATTPSPSTTPLPSRSVAQHRSRRQQSSNDRNQHPPPPPSLFLEPEDHPNTQQRLIGVQQRARRWLPSNEPQRSVIVGITSFGSPVIVPHIYNFKH